jgi:hypothetical protein
MAWQRNVDECIRYLTLNHYEYLGYRLAGKTIDQQTVH